MDFKGLLKKIRLDILDPLVGFLIAVGVIIFLIGVVKYIKSGDNEDERKKGREFMIYGIIGLFVMVSIWGLVALLIDTFGIYPDKTIPEIRIP